MPRRNAVPRNKREAYARERALAALALMRREGTSLRAAAKANGTNPGTVQHYVGSALRKEASGRFRATAYDRIARTLNFSTPQGDIAVTVRSSRTASRIAEYLNAVKQYLAGRDNSVVERFRGKSFRAGGATHVFITDSKTLDQFGDAGFPAEGIYRLVHSNGV